MKKLIMLLAAVLPLLGAYAQEARNFDRNAQVPATELQITAHKTTLLIFRTLYRRQTVATAMCLPKK